MYWDRASFFLGTGTGVVIAGIFGFLLQQIRRAREVSRSPRRPQRVIQNTRETPSQVVRRSIRAVFQWLLWGAVLVGFVGLVVFLMVRLVYPF